MVDELGLSFERLLIEDVIAAIERRTSDDTQANRRDLTRAIFAAIEGLVWRAREHVRETAEATGDLSPLAALALREINYQVDEQGRLSEQTRFITLPAMIRLTVEQAKLLHPDIGVDFGGTGWSLFKEAIAIRNRITHPKSIEDMRISNGDMKVIQDGFSWLLATCLEIMISVHVAHVLFVQNMRTLLDKLKEGDPAALALYHAELNRDDRS